MFSLQNEAVDVARSALLGAEGIFAVALLERTNGFIGSTSAPDKLSLYSGEQHTLMFLNNDASGVERLKALRIPMRFHLCYYRNEVVAPKFINPIQLSIA